MKFLVTLSLAALAAATPVVVTKKDVSDPVVGLAVVEKRQRTGTTAKEFSQGGCRDNIFVFSRGSTEIGNMVCFLTPSTLLHFLLLFLISTLLSPYPFPSSHTKPARHTPQDIRAYPTTTLSGNRPRLTRPQLQGTICGPQTSDGLKAALGDDAVATEGVDYDAALATNFLDGGANLAGIAIMTDIINQAASDCPNSSVLVGGYSQGAAMVHRVVESLDPAVQDQIAGVITFGDTQNAQDDGQINGFDADKLLVICNTGDAVCDGTLNILPAHLDYTRRADEAVEFLVGKVQSAAAKSKSKRA
ncbi:Uu.00g017160.m01.CDS01 [Anthostomella pinea]|uniref:cutinase n=1 Tax=Anthostomella pinea TaxID=933095 RepID=A0AAI8VYV6_9PEZI|nr:Uu.00g017160.m01.CDS01 [Anthostomella pinea]